METVINKETLIHLQLDKGDNDKYPLANIRDMGGILIEVLTLVPVTGENGLYSSTHTPTIVGSYSITYTVYSDVNHTLVDLFYDSIVSETLIVSKENIGADIQADIATLHTLVDWIRKAVSNNELLDESLNRLVIYDDNGVDPLITFNLYDKDGVPAYIDVFERRKI